MFFSGKLDDLGSHVALPVYVTYHNTSEWRTADYVIAHKVQKRNQCNFGLTWPKFGCHGNRPCFPENSDSIFEFADPAKYTI